MTEKPTKMAWLQARWKAVAAAVGPLVTAAVAEWVADLETLAGAVVAAAVTALLVHQVPNKGYESK